MRDYDERTIWSSDRFPLMTSYNKGLSSSSPFRLNSPHALVIFTSNYSDSGFSGKMQHSVWAAEFIDSNREASASCSSGVAPDTVFPKRVSFRRIWQAKGAKKAASKVTMISF